ncbi:hypothetical protein BJX70DRAFT_367938 [Aspergillus crustosus]
MADSLETKTTLEQHPNGKEEPSVYRRSHGCLSAFLRLLDRVGKRGITLPLEIDDEYGWFKVWAGNIGALHAPSHPTSVDSRLSSAPKIRSSILWTLERLQSYLQKAEAIVNGDEPNRTSLELIADDELEQDRAETTEIVQLLKGIRSSITHLFRLSILIRQSKPRGREAKSSVLEPLDPAVDVMHVRDRYPKTQTSPWLTDRLGKAITARREYFRYRKRRYEEQHAQQDQLTHDAAITVKATTFEGHESTTVQENLLAIDAVTQGLSRFSVTSYATSIGEGTENTLRVPGPPKGFSNNAETKDDEPFECPYCLAIQIIRDRPHWKRHVFEDLQPYICTSEGCTVPPFTRRHEWFEHESDQHRKQWHCIICSKFTSHSDNTLITHLKREHQSIVTVAQLPLIASTGGRVQTYFGEGDCPLCNDWRPTPYGATSNARSFRRHLGQHLEQLALSALPKISQDETSAIDRSSSDDDSLITLELPTDRPQARIPTDESDNLVNFNILVRLPKDDPTRASLIIASLDPQCRVNLMALREFERLNADNRFDLEPVDAEFQPLEGASIKVVGIARGLTWHLEKGARTYICDFYIVHIDQYDIIIGSDTILDNEMLQWGSDLSYHTRQVATMCASKGE